MRVAWPFVALALVGCEPRVQLGEFNEADELRVRVHELEGENRSMERRVSELEAELRRSASADPIAPDVRANTPRIAEIAISRLSHVADVDDDGVPDTVRVYVEPVDGRGRFVQLVGRLSAHAALLPGDSDSTTIGRASLDPGAVRDAYRSGLTGTHYTVEVPIDVIGAPPEGSCVVRVVYEDGRTGLVHDAERAIALR